MSLASVLIGLTVRSGVSAIVSANIAFEDIKFFIKLILVMLFAVLLLQYRSSRRAKKLLKKVECLGKQQKQVAGLHRRITNLVEQLDILKKNDALMLSQLEQMAYWSCKQGSDLEKQADALGKDMGRLIKGLGTMPMRVAAQHVDMQLPHVGKSNKHAIEDGTNEVDESAADSKGFEHREAMYKQEHERTSVDNEAIKADIATARSTASIDEYEEGIDWESVAVRIDRRFPTLTCSEH